MGSWTRNGDKNIALNRRGGPARGWRERPTQFSDVLLQRPGSVMGRAEGHRRPMDYYGMSIWNPRVSSQKPEVLPMRVCLVRFSTQTSRHSISNLVSHATVGARHSHRTWILFPQLLSLQQLMTGMRPRIIIDHLYAKKWPPLLLSLLN